SPIHLPERLLAGWPPDPALHAMFSDPRCRGKKQVRERCMAAPAERCSPVVRAISENRRSAPIHGIAFCFGARRASRLANPFREEPVQPSSTFVLLILFLLQLFSFSC